MRDPHGSTHELVDSYLREAGQRVGVSLALDHKGVCGLQCADDLTCGVVVLDEGTVGFFAPMLTVADGDGARLFPLLLGRNIFSLQPIGASLGFDASDNSVMFSLPLTLDGLDPTLFSDRLADFIAAAGQLKNELAGLVRECADTQAGSSLQPSGPAALWSGLRA